MASNPEKYFIITAGPTGSGKTGLVNVTFAKLGIDEKTEYTKFLIDDLIENDAVYKKQIREIIDNIDKECKTKQEHDCEKNKYINPSSELLTQFNTLYFEVRDTTGCKEYSDEGANCGLILDNRLKAIAKMEIKPFIIVFEITGISIPKWLLNNDFIPDDYTIIVSYSFVNFTNLLIRNTSRTYKTIIDFKDDTTNTKPAPRLPDIRPEVFKKKIITIKTIIIELYNKCIITHTPTVCGSRKIDRLLIYDNNSTYTNIFDSSVKPFITTDEFKKILDSSLGHSKIKKTRKNMRKNKSRRRKNKSRRRKNKSRRRKINLGDVK